MASIEPLIVVPQPVRNLCPICGKASYSKGGIHPQCAMQQADQPRIVRLRAEKVAETKISKPKPQAWKKRCPKCGATSHVRRGVCECGHKFNG